MDTQTKLNAAACSTPQYDGQAKPVRALVRYCNVHEYQWNTVTDTVCSIVILPLVPGQYYVSIHVLRCDITYNTVMSRMIIMCTGSRIIMSRNPEY